MNKEEYYKQIERINDKFKTDRVSADEEYQLVSQRNYLSTKYIGHLEQQCKKQKEVIDKARNWTVKYQTEWCQEDEVIRDLKQLLDILKEV